MSALSDLISNELKYISADVVDNIVLHYLDCLEYLDDHPELEIKCTDEVRRRWVESQTVIKKNKDMIECKIFCKTEYLVNGNLHREEDQPAIIYPNDTKKWYQNEKLHRDGDKPAIEYSNGSKEWYLHNERHRDGDKPAIEYSVGFKVWYQHGKRHREGDKPAAIYAYGSLEWWTNGKCIKKSRAFSNPDN